MIKSNSFSTKTVDAVIWLVLAAIAFVCIGPIINSIAISFSDKAAANAGFVNFWPIRFTLYSYNVLFEDNKFFRAFGVSIERVLLGGALNFIFTVLMAYPLSKEGRIFRSRNAYMWIIVFTLLFNGGLIPWYMTIRAVGLIDSIWALVLPGAVPVFNVILLMNFFRGIPKELEEAAVVDGSGPWNTLFRVYLPVSLPALATVTLFSIVSHWNSFFDGLMLINHPVGYPLQTYIQTLFISLDMQTISDPQELQRLMAVSNLTLNSAKVVVSMLPILLIYPFLQRYFIHGIVLGSVKE